MSCSSEKRALPKATVVYDRQCPACHSYCCLLVDARPEDSVDLLDARAHSELMDEITRRGLDIDEGMVVELEGELYYGADAIHIVASQTESQGVFNVMNRLLFGNRKVARVMYPTLKLFRNGLLRLLGVEKINNLNRPK